ncbi:hypothetical protein [Roseibium sp.]|uniref:hypothetical protein n=1 Tax=Roseibium sp. TaxID=1936156 RepID=UPI001B287DE6|nr:hypothetical protein [Roseibium sp.]MBO6858495.1 hypothetical protein [Roseibium sp.]
MKSDVFKALSAFVEVLSEGGEVIMVARISHSDMDEISAFGAELEDLEDDGTTESEPTTDGWSG